MHRFPSRPSGLLKHTKNVTRSLQRTVLLFMTDTRSLQRTVLLFITDTRSLQRTVLLFMTATGSLQRTSDHYLFILTFSLLQSFQTHNTPEQNNQTLQNFDLTEYRQVLTDVAVHIYQELLKTIQDKISSLIGKRKHFWLYLSRLFV